MKIDVSEVKSFRNCKRQWYYSSRNKYHLRPRATKSVFIFGTLMHEALHDMYMGANFEGIMTRTMRELPDPADRRVMTNILEGYYEQVLPGDFEKYDIKDIEYRFDIPITTPNGGNSFNLVGSIDMLMVDKETNELWGVEHKSARAFRDPVYAFMDEQPRVYTYALQQYAKEKGYKFGGIFVNTCKKTVKIFQHERIACVYDPQDLNRFMYHIFATVDAIFEGDDKPEPAAIKCQMCDYSDICQFAGFNLIELDDLLEEFSEEYAVREVDHLEEKVERSPE